MPGTSVSGVSGRTKSPAASILAMAQPVPQNRACLWDDDVVTVDEEFLVWNSKGTYLNEAGEKVPVLQHVSTSYVE